jgi:trigger factor
MATTELENSTEVPTKPELSMDVKVDTKSTCERHVVVSIPRAEVERYRKEAYNEIVPKAELPGFRAGKAPRKLVESRFKEQVTEQVKSSLVMDSLQKVTDGDYFSAIGEPNLDYEAVDLPEEGDFVYEFDIEVRPDFETPNWKGLSLERPVCTISEKHVDEHLGRTLTRFMEGEAVEGACRAGDTLTLNGQFSDESGKVIATFQEETAVVRQKLTFGDAQLDGFDKLIAGKKEGDKVTTKIKLSDSAANEELRGKEVDAEFEIVEIKRIAVEEISTELLEKLGFDNTKELREFVENELKQQFEYHQQQSMRKQAVAILTAGANWELPESLVRTQTNRELQRMVLELQRSGFSQEQITSYVNMARINARESTIAALREHFVLEKIAEDLKLEPTPKDYDDEIALIAEQNDSSPRRIRARLEKTGQMDALRNQIIERMVIEKIAEEAKVQDKLDESFLTRTISSDIDFAIAGNFDEIPEAKHDNAPADIPGAAKLPEKEKSEKEKSE